MKLQDILGMTHCSYDCLGGGGNGMLLRDESEFRDAGREAGIWPGGGGAGSGGGEREAEWCSVLRGKVAGGAVWRSRKDCNCSCISLTHFFLAAADFAPKIWLTSTVPRTARSSHTNGN